MNFRVILFSKFALLYCLLTWVRNKLYDKGWKKSRSFSVKTICVGNLSMGGTGKSPMAEYVIRLLKEKYKIATLSRGYKRKTQGFAEVDIRSTSAEVGDEPKQFRKKFPGITVAVCEDRCTGIDTIIKVHNDTEVIVLDDAFQHRKVKAGLNILLTDYNKLFTRDYVFPSGTLRESRKGAKRADVIVVTKCPNDLKEDKREAIINEIKKRNSDAVIVFSRIRYTEFMSIADGTPLSGIEKIKGAVLFTGIANPAPLKQHLEGIFNEVRSVRFGDHHEYSEADLVHIQETFNNIAEENKIVITTEKDAMRLDKYEFAGFLKSLPVYVASIEIDFSQEDRITFNQILMAYAEHDRKNS